MAQPETLLRHAAAPAAPDAALDGGRLEQFVALQGMLLESSADPDTLPERLVQAIAVFLALPAAAVGTVERGTYRILACYGPSLDEDAGAGPPYDALAAPTPRPFVRAYRDGRRAVVLPFRREDLAGALHLVLDGDQTLADDDLQLARALAALVGVALVNARRCSRLAEIARVRGEALAAMAHDLRAPLNALIGYTSLLAEGAFGPLSEEQRTVCGTLERQALELVDLLGATLDVARLESGRLPLAVEEFALGDVLEGLAAGTFARVRGEGRLTWTVASDVPRLRSDRVKVKQILQNLVDNALKYGGGGQIGVEIVSLAERGTLRLTVRDRGPGIDPAVLAHLFEPFRPGSRHGTGFGLYLVRRLAEALGGRVAARSAAGEGTAMTVELPLRAPAAG